jgi:subtilisin family serine protease
VAAGIRWAADNNARVINLSFGGDIPCSQTLQSAVDYAWSRGAVLVAMAGNFGAAAPWSPASCNHVLAVGAIDRNDARASFSNHGTNVPLAAPGIGILTTDNQGGYTVVSGTALAAPHVAGVAALVFGTGLVISNQSVVTHLLQTADPIVGTGSIWGSGRVNAAAAVRRPRCVPVGRADVRISATSDGSALNVVAATGSGGTNVVRYIRTGTAAGTTRNALVTFPTPTWDSSGTQTYVPRMVGETASFQVRRQVAGSPTTLPFIVTDSCGDWKSFVGGGTRAGF